MVRAYKRKPGTGTYSDYTPSQLKEYLQRIRNGEMTQAEAARLYQTSMGGQQENHAYFLKKKEESTFVKCALQLSEYGFPITELDIRHIVGADPAYLQQIGRNVCLLHDVSN